MPLEATHVPPWYVPSHPPTITTKKLSPLCVMRVGPRRSKTRPSSTNLTSISWSVFCENRTRCWRRCCRRRGLTRWQSMRRWYPISTRPRRWSILPWRTIAVRIRSSRMRYCNNSTKKQTFWKKTKLPALFPSTIHSLSHPPSTESSTKTSPTSPISHRTSCLVSGSSIPVRNCILVTRRVTLSLMWSWLLWAYSPITPTFLMMLMRRNATLNYWIKMQVTIPSWMVTLSVGERRKSSI